MGEKKKKKKRDPRIANDHKYFKVRVVNKKDPYNGYAYKEWSVTQPGGSDRRWVLLDVMQPLRWHAN